MKIKEYCYDSKTGVCKISARKFAPDTKDVKAVIVMHHGMAEHSDRYLDFFEYLTSKGYVVYMNDMANHGKSNQHYAERGYFGDENGYKALVADFNVLYKLAKKEYPNSKIVIAGHSMGSFVARYFVAQCKGAKIDGLLCIGTSGPNPMSGAGKKISELIGNVKGKTFHSNLLNNLCFGSFNNKTDKITDFDWLSKDRDVVDKYVRDDMCGFLFTAQGMNDLINLIAITNTKQWYENVDKNLPILIASGANDPVGDYGKGVRTVYNNLVETGHENAKLWLYENDRHEILNETNKESVYEDIDRWITNFVLK